MSRDVWVFHIENYGKMARETGVTIAAYAEIHGLNPNTCRRYFRKPKEGDKPLKTIAKPQKKKKLITDRSDDLLITKDEQKNQKKIDRKIKAIKEVEAREAPLCGGRAFYDKDDKLIRYVSPPRGTTRTQFQPGNKASVVYGRYSTPTEEDITKAQELIENGILDSLDEFLISQNLAHLMLISRSRDRSIAIFDEMEAERQKLLNVQSSKKKKAADVEAAPQQDVPNEFKKLGMLVNASEAIYGITKTLSGMRNSIEKRRQDDDRRDVEEMERVIIQRAFEYQVSESWTAFQTAAYIEKQGIKIPATLLMQVQAELKTPPPVESGRIDEDELERQAREYKDRQLAAASNIEDRRNAVSNLVDSGGYGDIDQTGEVRADMNFVEEEDDDDWDEDATSEYYDGDDD